MLVYPLWSTLRLRDGSNAPREAASMVTVGLWVMLEAKPGKEAEVAQFLKSAAAGRGEPATSAWFASDWAFNIWHLRCVSG